MIIGTMNPIKFSTIDIKKIFGLLSIRNDANGGPTITQEINPAIKSINAMTNFLVFRLKPTIKFIMPILEYCLMENYNHF